MAPRARSSVNASKSAAPQADAAASTPSKSAAVSPDARTSAVGGGVVASKYYAAVPTTFDNLLAIFLMIVTPLAAVLFVHANINLKGSLWSLGEKLVSDPLQTLRLAFLGDVSKQESVWSGDFVPALKFLGVFSAFEIALQLLVPGRTYRGPVTPMGVVPVYKANGFQAFAITLVVFLLFPLLPLPEDYTFKHTVIYDVYQPLIVSLCLGSFAFCAWLYVKGLHYPSGPDSGSSGSAIMDFYWGTELYPRVGPFDVKLFTNCRFGLMLWALAPISFAAHQIEAGGVDEAHGFGGLSYAMAVNVALQLVYLAKVRRTGGGGTRLRSKRGNQSCGP